MFVVDEHGLNGTRPEWEFGIDLFSAAELIEITVNLELLNDSQACSMILTPGAGAIQHVSKDTGTALCNIQRAHCNLSEFCI